MTITRLRTTIWIRRRLPQRNCDIYSSRSLRDMEETSDSWELAHFRLPLSGALKSHHHLNNNSHGYVHSNSSSNLSGILQPPPLGVQRTRLKPSPTISTLLTSARSEANASPGPETGSMGSGQLRIKFAEGDETPLLPTPPPLAAPPPIPQMVAASPQRSGSGQNIPADSSHYGFLVKSYSSSAHRWRAVPSPSHCWPRSTHSCMGESTPLHCNHMHIKCTCL